VGEAEIPGQGARKPKRAHFIPSFWVRRRTVTCVHSERWRCRARRQQEQREGWARTTHTHTRRPSQHAKPGAGGARAEQSETRGRAPHAAVRTQRGARDLLGSSEFRATVGRELGGVARMCPRHLLLLPPVRCEACYCGGRRGVAALGKTASCHPILLLSLVFRGEARLAARLSA
jgi:hypothetical protein